MSKLINFYSLIKQDKKHNPNYEQHGITVPFRMLVVTASGGGKSNYVLNLLYLFNNTFHKLIIITKETEPLYDLLEKKLKDRVEIYYNTFPTIEKLDKNQNGLIIYDDMVLTQDASIGEMFIRGRKLGFSSIFISQSYFMTSKLIRQNVNYIGLGRGINRRDLRLILKEYSISLSNDKLEELYFDITKTHMHFMLIDLHKRNIRHNIEDIITEF